MEFIFASHSKRNLSKLYIYFNTQIQGKNKNPTVNMFFFSLFFQIWDWCITSVIGAVNSSWEQTSGLSPVWYCTSDPVSCVKAKPPSDTLIPWGSRGFEHKPWYLSSMIAMSLSPTQVNIQYTAQKRHFSLSHTYTCFHTLPHLRQTQTHNIWIYRCKQICKL